GPRVSPAGSATSGRPPVHRSAVPSVPEDEPDADGSFQQVLSEAALRHAKRLAAAGCQSALRSCRRRSTGPQLSGAPHAASPRLSFVQALSSHHGVAEVRVNHRQNIVAVDATTRKGLEELLVISELQSIPVTAKEPADLRTSTDYLHGADRGPEVGSLLPGLLSTMIVLSDTREGHTVTLLFGVPFPQSRNLGFLQQAQQPQGGHQSRTLQSPLSRRTSQMLRGLSSRYDRRLLSGVPKDWLLLAASQPCGRVDGALPALSSLGLSRSIPRLSFFQALSSHHGVAEIRVNHRQNIVAEDATTRKGLEELLAISELQSIPVTAKEPADLRTSTSYLDLGFLQQAQQPQGGHQFIALPSPVSRRTSQMPRVFPAALRSCRRRSTGPQLSGAPPAASPRLSFVQALSSHRGFAEIRVNHRQNIVAVDATTRKGLVTIPVTAKGSADLRTSTGYLHGADRGPEVGSLLPGLLSTMIVLSDTSEGHTVTLLFGVPFPQSR
ncbi:hypothetical protein MRX96_044472, partial [Rhipicephalus microplus]